MPAMEETAPANFNVDPEKVIRNLANLHAQEIAQKNIMIANLQALIEMLAGEPEIPNTVPDEDTVPAG
jgi:hypothetical protein